MTSGNIIIIIKLYSCCFHQLMRIIFHFRVEFIYRCVSYADLFTCLFHRFEPQDGSQGKYLLSQGKPRRDLFYFQKSVNLKMISLY